MRQLAGTKAMYRRAHAAPLTGLIYGRAEYRYLSNGPYGAGVGKGVALISVGNGLTFEK